MFGGMMDPEMIRLAQEQMSRIPPEQLARMQQQIMSNPDLVRAATESMKNLRPEDMKRAAEQMKHTRPEDMAQISEKIAKAKPEELAAMQAQADVHVSYELNAAQMMKKQGNELYSRGLYQDAANKYLIVKNNLRGIPDSRCQTLQLQCSLNLMSCYLKTRQFGDCIKEGSEVLENDSDNLKALYRRGQAYKELGNLSAAVSDLSKAHIVSPDDETVADVLRDVNEKLLREGGDINNHGLDVEEIMEDASPSTPSESKGGPSEKYFVTQPVEAGESSQNVQHTDSMAPAADDDYLKRLKDDPDFLRSFKNSFSKMDPASLAALGGRGMTPDMITTATGMIKDMDPMELQKMLEVASALSNGKDPNIPLPAENSLARPSPGSGYPDMTPEMVKMASERISMLSPEELQSMFEVASSANGNDPTAASSRSNFPGMTPEMVKMASDKISKMSPEELQNMLKVASAMNAGGSQFSSASAYSESRWQPSVSAGSSSMAEERGPSSSSFPASADLQEDMRNSMKDPAMRQMFTSMMANVSPEMMANMSEQFGMKMSKEDAAKAQQVMSSLSPEDVDRMMRWADSAQRGVETVMKTKNWLLGRPGMIFAIIMLVIAFIFHKLGFIGG